MSVSISWVGDCESFDDFIIFAQLKNVAKVLFSMMSGLLFDECEKSIQMVDYSNYARGAVILK